MYSSLFGTNNSLLTMYYGYEQNDQTLSFHGAYILIRQKPGNYIHTNIHICTCKHIYNVEAKKN